MPLWDHLPTYTDLFVSRSDDYAVQLEDGRYRRVGKPLQGPDLVDHLQGRRTYGVYVQNEQGVCRFAVFDADSQDGLSMLWRLHERLARHGIASYLEQSRRGGHLWLFFKRPALASWVRAWLLPWCPSGVEMYPKQDETKGYGSLIRFPLGVHRLTGKRYPWLCSWSKEQGGVIAAATMNETFAWLATVKKVSVPAPLAVQQAGSGCPVAGRATTRNTHIDNPLPTTGHSTLYPTIDAWCRAQEPLSFIRRYIDLSQNGIGRCPFGEHHQNGRDTSPSLKVYKPSRPGGCCWHCYTWGKGGNVFNFLCYWHGVDARTMWHRIQAGEVF